MAIDPLTVQAKYLNAKRQKFRKIPTKPQSVPYKLLFLLSDKFLFSIISLDNNVIIFNHSFCTILYSKTTVYKTILVKEP